MQELGMLALLNRMSTPVSHSALPDSPVVPDRPPSRLRLLAADALYRLANRLDRGRLPSLRYGRPA
jgi:hypothetical protein